MERTEGCMSEKNECKAKTDNTRALDCRVVEGGPQMRTRVKKKKGRVRKKALVLLDPVIKNGLVHNQSCYGDPLDPKPIDLGHQILNPISQPIIPNPISSSPSFFALFADPLVEACGSRLQSKPSVPNLLQSHPSEPLEGSPSPMQICTKSPNSLNPSAKVQSKCTASHPMKSPGKTSSVCQSPRSSKPSGSIFRPGFLISQKNRISPSVDSQSDNPSPSILDSPCSSNAPLAIIHPTYSSMEVEYKTNGESWYADSEVSDQCCDSYGELHDLN
ncbi:hypothetical protein NE237_005649 [Protea cynaroides]|uniref:Uncharacterized protein n=1 Tax=Protea cynaroides TaxID=273540 RepID=A0A9Q0QUE7_9MAGN|nr:hypothetical protein NE237_005649 [Protea cynaroides]